jgi:hypothetical protein
MYYEAGTSYPLQAHGRGGSRGWGWPHPKIGKNKIFWRKIVIFHTKYPQNIRTSFRSVQLFLSAPPNLKSWIHPCMDSHCVLCA